MITIKASSRHKFQKRQWTRLINGLSGAKSANLVGTISKSGHTNLSIISSVFHLGANPPLMGFILRPHLPSSPRHTFLNIKETKAFTLNHVNQDIFKKAHQTSARFERKVSEFKACDLTEEFKDNFKAPFVKESRIQIGLDLIEITTIKHNKTHLIIGEVKTIYLEEKVLRKDGSLDIHAANTLALSGLDEYHSLNPIARLSYAKPFEDLEEI